MIWVFLEWNLKIILSYLKSGPSTLLNCKFREKMIIPRFGTENALFGYFWAEIYKQYLPYLKLAPSNLSIRKILEKKQNWLSLGPNVPYLGIFGLEFYKTFVIFEISTLKFVYLENFAKKQKFLNLGTKVPYLGIFQLEF